MRLARWVSLIFDPRVIIPLMLTLAVQQAYSNGLSVRFLLLLLFVDVGLPFWFYIYLKRKKQITHWDIVRRSERVPLYTFTTITNLVGVMIAMRMGQMQLAQLLSVFWFLALTFTIVTMSWKVSIHSGVMAGLATFMVRFYGTVWLWMYPMAVVVAWSRLRLKRHGVTQVILGIVLGILVMGLGMKLIGI